MPAIQPGGRYFVQLAQEPINDLNGLVKTGHHTHFDRGRNVEITVLCPPIFEILPIFKGLEQVLAEIGRDTGRFSATVALFGTEVYVAPMLTSNGPPDGPYDVV